MAAPAPTRAFFYQNHPNQTDLHNYTHGSVVTPQVATAYRKSICMQEYDKLNSRFLIQLALFDCDIVTCTAKQNGFPPGVIQVARRENAAYQSHDINPVEEIGERIQYDTQIVDEIGTNGFTVVLSCADEIVGSASVKDWKPTAQENDWKPADHYVGKSADEASAMNSAPSVRETASCEGDVEVFMVAVKLDFNTERRELQKASSGHVSSS
ncbi:hypothetical protein Focb16_v003238 [Fusarium oxysporum f. sp. cubense]|uniref:Uncharacterized protein n=1 Tax=Fusarium oxysporum f. sp. cubense TaxID=61366 RepID=A0A559KM75_FUSOC|nr:hypothetical protein Focb16_v003238 [Fusarium oxysporum f. sp. cubense]